MRALGVFSIPGRGEPNPCFDLFFDALEPLGARPVPMSARRLALQQFDVLHLHFRTHFTTQDRPLRATASALILSGAFAATRLFGRPIVLTVHDALPLEPRYEWLLCSYCAFVRRCVTGYVLLSKSSLKAFVARFSREARMPWRLARHGRYTVELLDAAECAARRNAIAGAGSFFVRVLDKIKSCRALPRSIHISGSNSSMALLVQKLCAPSRIDYRSAGLKIGAAARIARRQLLETPQSAYSCAGLGLKAKGML